MGGVTALRASMVLVVAAGCGSAERQAAPSPAEEIPEPATVVSDPTSDDDGADPSSGYEGYPRDENGLLMVEPPVSGDAWPLDIPSGGVMSAEASGYEYERGEPDYLATQSVAVAVATVTDIGEPSQVVITGDAANDPATARAFADDNSVQVRVQIDEVLAGTAVEAGASYWFNVSGRVVDGTFIEFTESRIPSLGGRYLVFVFMNSVERTPVPGGQIFITGAGDGRIPLSEAQQEGLLDPQRWTDALATGVGDEFRRALIGAGLLPTSSTD